MTMSSFCHWASVKVKNGLMLRPTLPYLYIWLSNPTAVEPFLTLKNSLFEESNEAKVPRSITSHLVCCVPSSNSLNRFEFTRFTTPIADSIAPPVETTPLNGTISPSFCVLRVTWGHRTLAVDRVWWPWGVGMFCHDLLASMDRILCSGWSLYLRNRRVRLGGLEICTNSQRLLAQITSRKK